MTTFSNSFKLRGPCGNTKGISGLFSSFQEEEDSRSTSLTFETNEQSFVNNQTFSEEPTNKMEQKERPTTLFSPFLHQNSSQDRQPQQSIVTDRFVPTRKLLKTDSLHNEQSDFGIATLLGSSPLSVSSIYKKCIMLGGKGKSDDNGIDIFQNENSLQFIKKYSQGNQIQRQVPNLTKNSSLDFTDEIVKRLKAKRKINKLPFKVLDGPGLQDDFYLNLIDWSTQNYLAVALASNVYLWNGNNSKVTKLCDLGPLDTATSVGWAVKDPFLSLGTNSGELHIWDINKMKRIRVIEGHSSRISSISWSSTVLSTGSRDKYILLRDPRCSSSYFSQLTVHKQQVCGLKWSPDEQQLCSGGNDNKMYVWNGHSTEPVLKFSDHIAAVKALAWSPHQHGLLASGGGTADRTIKFRNTLTGSTVKSVDTGSQVCNLIFSKTLNEFVSTHGYSQNQINIWKYPKLEKVSTLTGHSFRVLFLAMSPDGSTIVTGAGDETLRFWKVFPDRNEIGRKVNSDLSSDSILIR